MLAYTDSVMGSWSFGYDRLNRLVTAENSALPAPSTPDIPAPSWAQYFCWAYDSFGNRLQQSTSDMAFTSGDGTCTSNGALYQNTIASYNAQNQMTSTNAAGFTVQPPGYDNAGDVTDDGKNAYLYDAEGRLCAVYTGTNGGMMGYLYDAAGNRVAKGTIASWSCDITSNGFQQTAGYVVGPAGEQLTEVDANNNWKHTNVYAGGKQIGTYDGDPNNPTLHFYFDDPLGTRRAQASSAGVLEAVYVSLPFGDGLAESIATGADDPTENHFTAKERDPESGNDYFGARYYASSVGRWLSPDWSDIPATVPYANFLNPQTLNLYAYVGNNPLSRFDDDGHDGCTADGMPISCSSVNTEAFTQCPDNQCSGAQWSFAKDKNGEEQLMSGALTQFQSFADGTSGYFTSGLTDAQLATLSANIQYDKAVTDYMKTVNVDRAKAESRISRDQAHMEGGHWNFPFTGPDPRSGTDDAEFRFPGSGLHIPKPDPLYPGTYIHDDTFNPTPIWEVWNLAAHGLVDYVGGHTLFSGGFTF